MFLEDGQITSQTLSTLCTCAPPSKSFILTEGWCILCCLEGSLLKQKEDIFKSSTGQTTVSDSRWLQKLTQRGNKMFMGTQGFHATLVFVVPDPQSLVISTAHNELSTRMEEHPTHPVIMANLYKMTKHHA